MIVTIEQIRAAIIRQEGAGPHPTNPGNLRGAPWLKLPLIVNGFWKPATTEQGIAGLDHVIALHRAKGETLREFISGYAPSADGNDTEAYVTNVAKWTGMDSDKPMWNYVMEAAT